MKKSRSKFLKIVDEKHDINFHWPYLFYFTDDKCLIFKKTLFTLRRINRIEKETGVTTKICWLQTIALDKFIFDGSFRLFRWLNVYLSTQGF
jgi:hypothetical protein